MDNNNKEIQTYAEYQTTVRNIPKKIIVDSKEESIMKKQYPFFVIAAAVYAIFSTFCLYKNASGIMAPIFVIGTFIYIFLCIRKLEIIIQKDNIFYIVSIIILAFSLFLTDDIKIIVMNYLGIFLLIIIFMLHLFYQDKGWSFEKYVSVIGSLLIEVIAVLGAPFGYAKEYMKENRNGENSVLNRNIKNIAIGLGIAIPLLIVILALLISADRIFGDYIVQIVEGVVIPENLIGILLLTIFVFFTSFCMISALAKKGIKEEITDKRHQEPVIAITFTIMLSFIYLIFCIVQIMGLFLGEMVLPSGYSYAEYAREGFFQLLGVSLINQILVLVCLSHFKESKILKGILTFISLCTFILIASSAYRMILYINVYHLTFLRIFVLWALLVIFLIMVGILIYIHKQSFSLFRYSMIVVTMLYICFAYSHPDYLIAKVNVNAIQNDVEKMELTKYYDSNYLFRLSSDAAPILVEYSKSKDSNIMDYEIEDMNHYFEHIEEDYHNMNIRSFNLSRYIAGKIYDKESVEQAVGA